MTVRTNSAVKKTVSTTRSKVVLLPSSISTSTHISINGDSAGPVHEVANGDVMITGLKTPGPGSHTPWPSGRAMPGGRTVNRIGERAAATRVALCKVNRRPRAAWYSP